MDGVPYAMAGARRRHDRIVANTTVSIGTQLMGKPCEVFPADTAVLIPAGNVRLPDVGVDRGAAADDDRTAKQPRLVVEVLSPSTRGFDMFIKMDEYKAIPSLQYILLIDPEDPQAMRWSRGAGPDWQDEIFQGIDAVIDLPLLGLTLSLATPCDRVPVQTKPRLVG